VVGILGLKNCDSVYQEFAGMRQRVGELTELINQLRDLHTTQQQSRPNLSFDIPYTVKNGVLQNTPGALKKDQSLLLMTRRT